MPALTGVSATGGAGATSANVTIRLTGVSASVFQGFLRTQASAGNVLSITAPKPALAMVGATGIVGTLAITPPAAQLTLTGQVALTGGLSLTAPHPTMVMQGVTGASGVLALHAPAPQLAMSSGAGLAIRVPLPQLAMIGTQGLLAQLALRQPAPQLALVGSTPQVGTLALASPTPTFVLSGIVGASAQLVVAAPVMRLALAGMTETIGRLVLLASTPTLKLRGTFAAVGTLVLSSPAARLALSGIAVGTPAQIAAAQVAVVMQTERMAVTRYTNFPFNSFAIFGGRYLAASSAGIFTLSGDTDNGMPIDARARTGISDLSTSQLKRVDRVYMGYRAAGRMQVWVTVNEDKTRGYAAPPSDDKLRGAHIRLGKGVEARYWQFEVRNENGCSFTLDTLEVKPTVLPRRTGTSDA